MSLKFRKGLEGSGFQKLVALAFNADREARVSTNIHYDTTRAAISDQLEPTVPSALAVSAATATDTATAVTMVNDVKKIVNQHLPDAYAHKTAVSAVLTTADATNLATGVTLANAVLTAYTAHLTASNVHATNDTINAITAATCTNEATLVTLANDEKTQVNAHITAALAGAHLEPIDP